MQGGLGLSNWRFIHHEPGCFILRKLQRKILNTADIIAIRVSRNSDALIKTNAELQMAGFSKIPFQANGHWSPHCVPLPMWLRRVLKYNFTQHFVPKHHNLKACPYYTPCAWCNCKKLICSLHIRRLRTQSVPLKTDWGDDVEWSTSACDSLSTKNRKVKKEKIMVKSLLTNSTGQNSQSKWNLRDHQCQVGALLFVC
jgi:hypothetical protein